MPGELIAVEGDFGPGQSPEARRLAAETGALPSVWDASGVFSDLGRAEPDLPAPSARELMLLYATDLAYRLRCEIRPALDQGRTVVAAPYVGAAIAFGQAAGLSRSWLEDLFSFAPPAGRQVS